MVVNADVKRLVEKFSQLALLLVATVACAWCAYAYSYEFLILGSVTVGAATFATLVVEDMLASAFLVLLGSIAIVTFLFD